MNITAALAAHAELLVNFGGHPMAAGFGIDPERIPGAPPRALAHDRGHAGQRTRGDRAAHRRHPAAGGARPTLADDLGRLAPFGPGNPPLTLAAEQLGAARQEGRPQRQEHQLVIVTDEAGAEQQVIWWDGGSEPLPEGRFDLAYVARNSTYRGLHSSGGVGQGAGVCSGRGQG